MLPHLMWTQCSQLSHDIALRLLLTHLPHIPHGYCIGPGFGWINQVDDMNTSNISTGSNTSISSTQDNQKLLTILTMNCRSLRSEAKRNELNIWCEPSVHSCHMILPCGCYWLIYHIFRTDIVLVQDSDEYHLLVLVNSNHRAISCDNCEHWVHIKCGNISPVEYNNMCKCDNIIWSCPKCKQKETMNQTLHNGQTCQPTPITNNQVDDTHDIALWLLLTDLPHIPHGYCIGPGFGWISFASIKVRSTNVLNNFGILFLVPANTNNKQSGGWHEHFQHINRKQYIN
jgi:hypothetical protein